jgi:hypothetical protein
MRFLYTRAAAVAGRPHWLKGLVVLIGSGLTFVQPPCGQAQAGADSATLAASVDEPAVLGETTPVPPSYQHAIDQAVDEHERGNFEEAREHFRAAHELYPNARTYRGLGKVEFELRNYGESVKYLSAALSSTVRPLDRELRQEVESLLQRARAYVGEVRVDVQPGTATVSVDGVTVGSGPRAALELLVGDHVLEFRATGRMPERRHIRVHGRDQITIQVILAAPEPSAAQNAAAAAPRVAETPLRKRWWVWTSIGVIAAGTAIAVSLAATRAGSDDSNHPDRIALRSP